MKATKLTNNEIDKTDLPVIGIFATCDPRIDKDSRTRAKNIVMMTANQIAGQVISPAKKEIPVVYSETLVDDERQADEVSSQFKKAGVNIIICVPDTWAFPQLTVMSLLAHFPNDTPFNFTTGNSGPRPGVVFTHATNGALAQSGRLSHINVGSWDDVGINPIMTKKTKELLIDWCYSAVTFQALKGKRVVVFGHDSMGMETALSHVAATRNQFGIEITRLDMKLLSDMLTKKSYDEHELLKLKKWIKSGCLNLERPKEVIPYATEADVQALLTQLFMTWLTGGNPPLFMDFRKVWEPYEINEFAKQNNVKLSGKSIWEKKGFVDGVNSGSASFDWAALPGTPHNEILNKICFPKAVEYFSYMGNSVHFISPAGIEGIAARLAYSSLSGMFSMVWDEAETVLPPMKFSKLICETANPTWPHTFVVPKHATMLEYKQYAPANHFHMTWNLKRNRLQYWMDLTNVLSVTPWKEMPLFQEGTDRPIPLLYLINGGENHTKIKLKR